MIEFEQKLDHDLIQEHFNYLVHHQELLISIDKQEHANFEGPTKIIIKFEFLKELKK